jgi:hypothetical protein
VDEDELRLGTSADDRHHAVARPEPLDVRSHTYDLARQLHPRDVLGAAGGSGVEALDLKQVGGVDAGCPRSHQELARARNRIGPFGDDQGAG